MFSFNSQIQLGRPFNASNFSQDEVKNEPMLFSCDFNSAVNLGGPITRDFLSKVPLEISCRDDFIVDSRVHMLMPGWYACIPGFHHDDVPRTLSTGQPNYYNPEYKSQHVMGLVNGDICPTQFVLGEISLPDVKENEKYYKVWHPLVAQEALTGKDRGVWGYSAPSDQLIYFNWQTFHSGTAAVSSGWRWFIRCSWNTHRKATNELRRQVQVYLEYPMEGW